MSENYEKVSYYYHNFVNHQKPAWDIERVRKAVEKGWITEEEFSEITGEDY